MEEPWDFEFLSRLLDGLMSFVSEFVSDWLANDVRVAIFKILLGWFVFSLVAIHFAWKVYGPTVNDMYYRQGECLPGLEARMGGLRRWLLISAAGRGWQAEMLSRRTGSEQVPAHALLLANRIAAPGAFDQSDVQGDSGPCPLPAAPLSQRAAGLLPVRTAMCLLCGGSRVSGFILCAAVTWSGLNRRIAGLRSSVMYAHPSASVTSPCPLTPGRPAPSYMGVTLE